MGGGGAMNILFTQSAIVDESSGISVVEFRLGTFSACMHTYGSLTFPSAICYGRPSWYRIAFDVYKK